MTQTPSRRRFVRSLATAALALVPARLGGVKDEASEPPADPRILLLAVHLKSLIKTPRELSLLGDAYLRRYEIPPNAEQILRELFPAALDELLGAPVAILKGVVRSSVERDFRTGQLVNVAGWLMSLTEARLCALTVVVRDGEAR